MQKIMAQGTDIEGDPCDMPGQNRVPRGDGYTDIEGSCVRKVRSMMPRVMATFPHDINEN